MGRSVGFRPAGISQRYKRSSYRGLRDRERGLLFLSTLSRSYVFAVNLPKDTMRFVDLLVGAAAISGALAVPTKTRKRADAFQFTGVSESGAEFGNLALPGQLGGCALS